MPIVLDRVSFTYNANTPLETAALNEIDLQITDGEFTGIIGQTGCGKSTLIQLIAGLLVPAQGSVYIDGENINSKNYPIDKLRQRLSVIFQFPEYQLFETTVEKDIAFSLKHSGLSAKEIRSRVRYTMEMLGLSFDDIAGLSPMELSGGEKRKAAIAGALVTQPRILILDEPIAGLDPAGRGDFLNLLTKLNKTGVTIIMVSHNMDALGECARRILLMENGRLLMDAPPSEIFSDIEKLRKMRLDVCRPRKIANLLCERGLQFPKNIVRYGELLDAIKKIARNGAGS